MRTITPDSQTAEYLFKDLLEISKNNDFIIRLSASKVLSNLSNSTKFQNYIRIHKKEVFLDTQIILHAMCFGYETYDGKYENPYYQITEELIKMSRTDNSISLNFSKSYMNEVAHQLRLALHLIAFEDTGFDNYSENVFYQFYNYLKVNEILDDEHNSFSDFMQGWLLINEEESYESNFTEIAITNITSIIEEELGISIKKIPRYDHKEAVVNALRKVIIDKKLPSRNDLTLSNDALMLCHLGDQVAYEIEPFFLTWDKSFLEYRKIYHEKFDRMNPYTWHLFNPSKFINHISLLGLKIDSNSISNEYMCVMNNGVLMEQGRCLVDTMNKFLDIKKISKNQKRRYIQIMREFFNEKEFSSDLSLGYANDLNKLSGPFSNLLDIINSHYHDEASNYSFEDYRKALLKEGYFTKITKSISSEIKSKIADPQSLQSNIIKEIDKIIEEFKNEEKENKN